jgi:superfamily II DNA or RNA helicase
MMSDTKQKTKTDIQTELKDLWVSKGCKGTIVAATGVGKTRVGVMAARHVFQTIGPFKGLIVTPTTNLRDNE